MTAADPQQHSGQFVSGAASRRAAMLFNFGNLVAILLPMPLGVLWLAGSIAVYTMVRHHPNARVGYYTQWAAYRFYGLVGLVVVIATFFSTSMLAWLVTWATLALILIPWTIYDLIRIQKEDWQDMYIEQDTNIEKETV